MGLFCDFYRLGQEEGRFIALHIIFDVVFLFGLKYFEDVAEAEESGSDLKVMSVITTALYDPEERIQSISSEGFAKLFLHRVIDDKQVLEGLFHLYLHPATLSSSPIKQCLSYFFQAYAFISAENQLTIGSLVGKILGSWIRVSRQYATQQGSSLISLNSVANQLLYLIDRTNLVQSAARTTLEAYNEMYAQIAVDLSWVILNDPLAESAKIITSIICKLPLKSLSSPESPPLLKQLLFLQTQIMKYITDKPTINSLKRFTANLLQLDTQEEPLDFEIINEMKAEMLKILPAGIKANNAVASTNPASKKTKIISNETISGNIMDDISDLLEDE